MGKLLSSRKKLEKQSNEYQIQKTKTKKSKRLLFWKKNNDDTDVLLIKKDPIDDLLFQI